MLLYHCLILCHFIDRVLMLRLAWPPVFQVLSCSDCRPQVVSHPPSQGASLLVFEETPEGRSVVPVDIHLLEEVEVSVVLHREAHNVFRAAGLLQLINLELVTGPMMSLDISFKSTILACRHAFSECKVNLR